MIYIKHFIIMESKEKKQKKTSFKILKKCKLKY